MSEQPKKKRRRANPTPSKKAWKSVPRTIRSILGENSQIFYFLDFIRHYAPSLNLPIIPGDDRLRRMLVCPFKSLEPVASVRLEFKESLSSIVDGVIWTLVQRRENIRRGKRTDNNRLCQNVLAQGYVLASEQLGQNIHPCPNMRPGVLCTNINSNVSFCKTSSLWLSIHRLVGDELVRIILLHTTVLIPTSSVVSRENYLQVCGPPLQLPMAGKAWSSSVSSEKTTSRQEGPPSDFPIKKRKRRGRKRKRDQDNDTSSNLSTATNSAGGWQPNAPISRYSLFYSDAYVPRVGLPSNHMLNDPANKEKLLATMLSLYKGGRKRRKRWCRLRENGVSMCTEILKRHRKCDYARLLERHCPIPQILARKENESEAFALGSLAMAHTSSDCVISFLVAVLRKVFPVEFWGSEHNFQRARITLCTFVKLRRHEELPNKATMHGIRVTDIKWLQKSSDFADSNDKQKKSKTNHEATTVLVQQMMRWLFVQFLVPLLRSSFYITESEFSAKRVLYYRKPVWTIFRSISMKSLLDRQYVEISANEAIHRLEQQKMGFSRLRLLPKKTGARPIAALSRRELLDDEIENLKDKQASHRVRHQLAAEAKFRATNTILKNTFDILKYEVNRNLQTLGSGVFGVTEVYHLFRNFIQQVRAGHTNPRLYFTSVDIRHCYDNINQSHLYKIVESLITEEDYLIQKYAVIHPCGGKEQWLKKNLRVVGPPEKLNCFQEVCEELSCSFVKSIFVDGSHYTVAKKDDIFRLLQEHLKSHMVVAKGRFGNRFLLQSKCGIPQGSILSSLLCNLYYGHQEKDLLQDVFVLSGGRQKHEHQHLLVRVTDDFLLISTDRSSSVRFLERMNTGNPKLGVQINGAKTLVNYEASVVSSNGKLEKVKMMIGDQGGDAFFPWCGMLFNTRTGNVRLDYARFAGKLAGDALTVDRSGAEGTKLRIRIKTFVKPRCLPILFDPEINSKETIVANFIQAMLLCAIKFSIYIQGGMNDGLRKNVSFVLDCIYDLVDFAYNSIKKSSKDVSGANSNLLPGVSRIDAIWLAQYSFHAVFRQKGTEGRLLADLLWQKCQEQQNMFRRWGKLSKIALSQFDINQFSLD